MRATAHILDGGWQWQEASRDNSQIEHAEFQDSTSLPEKDWKHVHTFPSEIHVELLKEGLIPDPCTGFNEQQIQWVGERDWLYRCRFSYQEVQEANSAFLRFEGLDTFCDAYLNGSKILQADNMFRTYVVPLNLNSLVAQNLLLLHFKSAKWIAKALEAHFGKVRAGSVNLGDPSRVYARKAQYDWRWDWGPELMTCGPYRPISLVVYQTRLSCVNTRASVSNAPHLKPNLKVDIDISGAIDESDAIRCVLRKSGNEGIIRDETIQVPFTDRDEDSSKLTLEGLFDWNLDGEVSMWWPIGYGQQDLYDVEITLLSKDGSLLDIEKKTVGFRHVSLVQVPLEIGDRHGTGTTFLFEVNGVRMFMGGSNWIPADNFLTTITPERYRAWLTLLRDGNQNMVRLWGGGVYEPDIFYDICDELGILVWQDFQFACGVYPAHEDFVANVKAEAEDNVKRLRHHPCMALFCGNNEDYQQVLQWGDVPDLPARILYENVLPEVVKTLTNPPMPYHPGSPYGGQGYDTADPTVGDIHQWDIWAGRERPWQNYGIMGGRFVSEFGIPAFPDIRTVDYWLDGNQSERWAQSKLMAQHNRAGAHERRFAVVMNENFRLTGDFETHIYNTQIMQSEAVSLAYRMWRREWRGKGKEYCAGALVWQLNDCWPVTSWSLADYFLRPKPVYYTIARELKPISVGIFRTVVKNRDNDRPLQFYEFGAFQSISASIEVWGTNSTLKAQALTLELRCFDLQSDWTYAQTQQVTLYPNQSTELLDIPCPCPPRKEVEIDNCTTRSHSVIVQVRLLDTDTSEAVARYVDWPQPYRYIDFPDPELKLAIDGEQVTVTVGKPIKALVLSLDGEGESQWNDNALDVVPGDPQVVTVRGLAGRNLRAAYMGKEKPT